MSGLRELADKWEREQAEYPPTPEGQHAAAAVRCCIHELRALATRTPPQPSPVQGDGVSDPLVERACIAAYNECDMGSFPEQAVNPESDRRFVRAALAAAQPEPHTMRPIENDGVMVHGLTGKQAWWAGARAGLAVDPAMPRTEVAALLASNRAAAQPGGGFVMVPVEPTEAMRAAGRAIDYRADKIWPAMLAAAPKQSQEGG